MTSVLQQRVQMQNFQIIQKLFIIWMHKYAHPHLNAWFPGKAFKIVLFNIKKNCRWNICNSLSGYLNIEQIKKNENF